MPARTKFHPALEDLLRGAAKNFAQQVSEVLTNTIAVAADDALERIEGKAAETLRGIQKARDVAKKRSRRGRRA